MAPPTTVVTPAYPYLEVQFTIGVLRELGDGSVVQAQEYRGEVHVSGLAVTVPARITLLGEEYLLGRGIVDRLRMTFEHGQRLLVEM